MQSGVVAAGVFNGPRKHRTVYFHVENDAFAELRIAGAHRSQHIDRALARLAEYFWRQPGVVVSTAVVVLGFSN